jgi:hypothetical protein
VRAKEDGVEDTLAYSVDAKPNRRAQDSGFEVSGIAISVRGLRVQGSWFGV